MSERKAKLARRLGVGVAGLAVGMFVGGAALAEPPSHGFKPHPQIVPVTKPHKPHPQLNPNAPTDWREHPFNHPPTITVRTHEHKPHPALNPLAPPKH